MAPGLGEGSSAAPPLCLCGRLLGDSRRHRGHRHCCFHGPAMLGTHGALACADTHRDAHRVPGPDTASAVMLAFVVPTSLLVQDLVMRAACQS